MDETLQPRELDLWRVFLGRSETREAGSRAP